MNSEKDCDDLHQIVPYCYRYEKSLPVSEKDVFMFTGWWTAYCTQEAYVEFGEKYDIHPNPYINFIQDYEPDFILGQQDIYWLILLIGMKTSKSLFLIADYYMTF